MTRILLLASLCAATLGAQERIDTTANRRIRDEGLQRSRVMETARWLTDGYGPRLAGSAEYAAAARFAMQRLTAFGARDARLEAWGRRSPGWRLEGYSVEVTAPYYWRLQATPKGWSNAIPGTLRGVPLLVPITKGRPDTVAWHGKLRGRIVMLGEIPYAVDTVQRFTPGAHRLTDHELDSLAKITTVSEPKDYWEDFDPWEKEMKENAAFMRWLKREGVAAIVEPSRNELAITVTAYNSYASDRRANIPAFVVSRNDYRRLQTLLERKAPIAMKLALNSRVVAADSMGYNVIAELPGSDPALKDQVVMIGGHFDSWHAATGATDNGAGSAVAMEVLRILSATGVTPRRTVRVALWDGEEQEDYFGSMGYVKKHYGDPEPMTLKPEHGSLSAYFNYDQGSGKVRGVHLQGNAAAKPIFEQLLAPWADLGAANVTMEGHGQTDHLSFLSVGLPAFDMLQDPLDYESRTHHTSLDAPAWLIEADLKQASTVLASLVLHVANRDAMMPRMELPPKRGATKP